MNKIEKINDKCPVPIAAYPPMGSYGGTRTRKGGKRTKKDRKKTKKKGNTVKNKQIIIGGAIEKMIDYVELFDVYKDTLSYGLLQDKLYINLSVLTSKFFNSLDNPSSLYTGYFDNEIYNIKSNITDIRSLINSESSVMVGGSWWDTGTSLVEALNPYPDDYDSDNDAEKEKELERERHEDAEEAAKKKAKEEFPAIPGNNFETDTMSAPTPGNQGANPESAVVNQRLD
jgi:hypothetical protein